MIEDFFDNTALVQQVTTSQSATGGVVKGLSTRIESLACRIGTRNMSEVDDFGRRVVVAGWRLYCTASTANKAIKESDVITVGGQKFEVTGSKNPALLNHHLEIDLREVR